MLNALITIIYFETTARNYTYTTIDTMAVTDRVTILLMVSAVVGK